MRTFSAPRLWIPPHCQWWKLLCQQEEEEISQVKGKKDRLDKEERECCELWAKSTLQILGIAIY